MKRLFKFIVPPIILFSLIFWFVFPEMTSRVLINFNNSSASLSAKVVPTKLGDIHYLEGGHGHTIVLLHGIYARKEHWVDLARALTQRYHVIALDLPGFGDNQSLPIGNYNLNAQAKNLEAVLDALDIDNAHFGANSMGAAVLAILAAKRSEIIRTLAFIGSPLGVTTPIKSEMDLALENQNYPLVVKDKQDFKERNDWLFPKIPIVPGPILKTWMKEELVDPKKNGQIWHTVHDFSNTPTLLELAPKLNLQTLIIWCEEDRIFHLSGANVLDKALPKSHLEILNNCGHVPMLDKPKEVAEAYLNFLANDALR